MNRSPIGRGHVSAAITFLVAAFLSTNLYAAPPLSGAIFTTNADGSVVNGNVIYEDRCDVYLDGGPPPGAPREAAGLPDGDYYFQVTDPSGKKLLSTDAVEFRRITVNGGIITGAFNHPTNPDQDHGGDGAVVVRLCPYDLTPNNGGVYKAWVTPVDDFLGDPTMVDNACHGGCFHGFINAASKTDNFKVGDKEPTFCLLVNKQKIDDKGTVGVANWQIDITDPLGVTNTYFTGSAGTLEKCGLTAGTYTVTEALVDENGAQYDVVQTIVNGNEVTPPTTTVEISWTPGKDDPQRVEYVNQFVSK